MQTLLEQTPETLSSKAAILAESSSRALRELIDPDVQEGGHEVLRVSFERSDGKRVETAMPGETLSLLVAVLNELGHGKGVVIMGTDKEITTQQAADFLRVSRPYFVKLLTQGKIPFRSVGSRRRVLLEDVLRYKANEVADRHQGLDELVAEAQNLGMY